MTDWQKGWPQLEAWVRDLRHGLRVMRRRVGLATTVALTLALGIGAASTVFSLVDTVLLRPLPYPDSDRLMAVSEQKLADDQARTPVAPGRLEDWQRLTRAFAALAGSRTDNVNDTTGPEPERIAAAFVSPRFFTVLGAPAALGRAFHESEERFGGPAVAVISDGFWRRRFGASPSVLGRSLTLPGGRFVIVGVLPPAFQYPSPATEVWFPDRTSPDVLRLREARFFQAVGRLKAGVTVEQAQADLAAAQRTLAEQHPKTDAGWSVAVRPLKEELAGPLRLGLWLLLSSVGLLLLIACANVACLLLAQLSARRAEIATRLALGAGQGAIARQLLAEGLAYGMAGGLLGLAAAFAGVAALQKRLTDLPRISEVAVNGRVLGFALLLTLLMAALFSLAPMLQTFRSSLAASAGPRTIAGGSQRLSRFLVAAQLALATALLAGAGLFIQSLVRLQTTPLGFHPEDVLALRVSASFGEPPAATMARHQRLLEALATLPGVTSVAISSGLPGVNPAWPREFQIAGEPSPDGALQFAGWRIVTAGYFQTLSIPILAGHTCRMTTDENQTFELLVNRSFAERFGHGRELIGRTVIGGPIGDTTARIVGVVADVKENGASRDTAPVIYACGYLRFWPDSDILLRTAGDPALMVNAVRRAIRALEPARPVYAVRPLLAAMDSVLAQNRFRTALLALFSTVALLLAAVGLYGVMAYMVTQRTREIGVRVALGARPGQILREILLSGARLTCAGALSGIALAALASRWAGELLYGVRPFEPAAHLAAAGILSAVALLACLVPARRATAIDPMRALREP